MTITKHYQHLIKSTKDLIPYINNSRTHTDDQINQVASSIKEFGFTNPVLIDEDGGIIAGHGRILAANKLGLTEVPCIVLAGLTKAQKKAYIIADNQLALNAGWDMDKLKLEIEDLGELDFDVNLLGFDDDFINNLFDDDGELYADGIKGQMSSDFGFSPFTVFNAREGGWQKRKQYWISLGIKSESGRDENLISYSKVSTMGEEDTSIFDPVLCEIGYEWFSPKGGVILDPFAGGSVRGIVAAKCGRQYLGNDLSLRQIEANRAQAEKVCIDDEFQPVWTVGDSVNIKALSNNVEADAIFSCPPYADLEVYSDDPSDISNMNYDDFLVAYRKIISESYDLLKDDSFAVWTVGEVRDKKGNYINFVGDTINAFKDAGFNYYNEAILVTAVGSLPLRAGKMMRASRKLGKTHQNVLVFVKGDGKKAAQRCGDIEINIEEVDD
jgi:DNA modification methylase